DVQRDVQRDARPRADAPVPDLAEVLALDEVHRDEELAVDLARVEGRHQVRVRQPEHDLRLVEEALRLRAVAALGDDLLDDAELVEARVAGGGQIDLAHPAPRHRLEQDVLAESPRIGARHHQGRPERKASLARREPESARTPPVINGPARPARPYG